jgi:hypothetical protein
MCGDIDFAYSDGKVRISLDWTKFKGEAMATETINILKQMGMDNVISIAGTSSNFNYIIYPSLKSYVEVGYKEGAADDKSLKFEKTDLGEEVVAKQKCKKNKIVATDASGNKQEALVWNAPNIKGFPLQIKMKDNDNEVTMLFKNPKVETPSADLFKVPEGYKKYGSFEELMKSAVEKAMQNQKKLLFQIWHQLPANLWGMEIPHCLHCNICSIKSILHKTNPPFICGNGCSVYTDFAF